MRRVKSAALDAPMSDVEHREVLPMSTLISSEEWHVEAPWDGVNIGDVQVYRNRNWRNKDAKPDWHWWGGVPRGRIVSYRWSDDLSAPKALPSTDGERKEELRPAGEAGAEQRSAKNAR
jgi:hypothetical protein